MSEFHFSAAKITTAQICRAVGLERSVPSVLDAMTEILIQYLMMLGSTARDAAEFRGSVDATADDAMLAAVECSAVHGGLQSTELRNPNPPFNAGIEDILEIMEWLRSPAYSRIVAVARPQRQIGAIIGAAQGAALAALPSSAAAASQFQVHNQIPNLDQNQNQNQNQIQNKLPPQAVDTADPQSAVTPDQVNQVSNPEASSNDPHKLETQQDWLRTALNRQALMGHRDWFVNTELGPYNDPDPTIYR